MWSDNEHLNTQKVLSEQESKRTVGEERKKREGAKVPITKIIS